MSIVNNSRQPIGGWQLNSAAGAAHTSPASDVIVECALLEGACHVERRSGVRDSELFFKGSSFDVTTKLATPPKDGSIRLVNGSHRCEGRLEIFFLLQWGTVCDDAWDLKAAKVVCRSLGCGAAMKAWGEAWYGQGTGIIFLDNVKCQGNESSLLQCSYIRWNVHNCDHSEDAGVKCGIL
ncbi:unnamed protein product [Ranitomeya imitator]|uniref:SRCR domain-containing protein n=1 Tax=Ranitomeya imitator TaxID=111125 RepID=A0ABN9M146_9NEOB|nr:unnamed protein product [Ranitomeya imitator]